MQDRLTPTPTVPPRANKQQTPFSGVQDRLTPTPTVPPWANKQRTPFSGAQEGLTPTVPPRANKQQTPFSATQDKLTATPTVPPRAGAQWTPIPPRLGDSAATPVMSTSDLLTPVDPAYVSTPVSGPYGPIGSGSMPVVPHRRVWAVRFVAILVLGVAIFLAGVVTRSVLRRWADVPTAERSSPAPPRRTRTAAPRARAPKRSAADLAERTAPAAADLAPTAAPGPGSAGPASEEKAASDRRGRAPAIPRVETAPPAARVGAANRGSGGTANTAPRVEPSTTRRQTAAADRRDPDEGSGADLQAKIVALRRSLDDVRASSGDMAKMTRLGDAIAAAAAVLPSPAARARIRRIATSSALVGDVDGLARALDELSRAGH